MTAFLIALLSISAFMIVAGHFILSAIDRIFVYPRRLKKVQTTVPEYPPIALPPSNLPPAIVSQLVFFGDHSPKKEKSYTRFTVTLLDLVHRHKIFVTRKGDELYFSPLGEDSDLLPYERELKNFFCEAAEGRCYLSLTSLKSYIEEYREKAAEMRNRFLRELSDDFVARGFSDTISYEKETHPLVLIGEIAVLMSVGAMLGWVASNIPLGVISVCFAGIATTLCLQVFRYKITYLTPKGEEMRAKWIAYGNYLSQLTVQQGRELPAERWRELAVYAAALEQNKTYAELSAIWGALAEQYPECQLYDPKFYRMLCQIDYAILISNIRLEDRSEWKSFE